MAGVRGVLGEIPASELGFVLAHEHVVAASPGILRSWPAFSGGPDQLRDHAVEVLLRAKESGVRTIVDCTTFDLGRDVELLAEVSQRSGVGIVAATGIWLDPSATIRVRSEQEITSWFVSDLTEGMDGTDIRAGVIKVAHNETIEGFGELVLRAAATACLETGAPIITHTAAAYRTGEAQSAILEECGVHPQRVAIGHSDDSSELDYLTGLAERGYYIAMDRLPCGAMAEYGGQTIDDRVKMIVSLAEAGYADQVLLGHDDPIWAGLLTAEDQRRHVETNPLRLAFVSDVILPALSRHGLAKNVITQFAVDNPRRWLIGTDQ
jgi:phosphotriesterase-related protein